jgi:glycosyltransferase involved in cell wall biosynthesis
MATRPARMSQDLSAISVVVPVYQCAGRLPAHLDFIATLSQQVRELIWVITESPDGSCSMAKAAASKLGGKILEVPKGLYEAWNAGIAAAAGEFLYISTVGDVISADGLAALLGLLRKTGADVAFSPPVIYPPSKANLKRTRHWPLFYFEKLLRTHAGKIIPRQKAILMQILAGASGLTGSCASCLFRSSVLKMRPFPLDHHHYGDTAWLYHHLPEVTLAYWPQAVARFEIHSLEIRRIIDRRHIYRLTNTLAQHLEEKEKKWVQEMTIAAKQLDLIREPHPRYGWWMYHKAWWYRWTKNKIRIDLTRSITSIS